jgi:hypothetical protein
MKRAVVLGGATVVVVLVLAVALLLTHKQASPLPKTVTSRISFVVYYPSKEWQTASAQATYANSILRFTSERFGVQLSFSEQATPQVFNDVPQYYPSLLSKLNQYANLGTANGTVYLTKPKELQGGQTAVLNNSGTLLFVRPSQNMSSDEWRRLFNTMHVLK